MGGRASRVVGTLAVLALLIGLQSLLPRSARAGTTVTVVALTYGNPNDVPITGDWDGSGHTQIGVYRPSSQTFYLGDQNGVSVQAFQYGNPNDIPITGDWDGSGHTQIGVYRPSNQTFYLGDRGGYSIQAIQFGNPGDVPITGDWNGSGLTQIGVYRPSDRTFYLRVVSEAPAPAGGPTAPVQTQPVSTPVPTPPHARGHRRVRVRVVISWTWRLGHTRLVGMRVGRLPRGAVVRLSCRGRGCPHLRLTRAPADRLRRLH